MKLTKTIVDRLEAPASGQAFYRDDNLQGFALRITSSGMKSFVVEKRIKDKVRRKTLGRYGHLTVEQARKEAQKFLGKVATGIDPIAERRDIEAQNVTLREAFETMLKTRKGLKPNTVHDYQRAMREFFPDWLDRPMQSITKDAIGKRHEKNAHRPVRTNNAMRVLRAVFNFAAGQYEDSKGRSLFPENPVKRLSHTRAWYPVERRRTIIKWDSLPAWFEAVNALKSETDDPQAHTVADYLLLLLFTGMRRSEGMTLKWDDIDFAGRSFTLVDTKNREPHTLPLSNFLLDLLVKRKEGSNSKYVFPGDGKTGHLVEPRPQIRKIIARSGVDFTFHDLRRTFISAAEALDISMYTIKRLANHKMGNDVTMGYIVTDVGRLREPMQKITDFLLSAARKDADKKVVNLDAYR